jgi:pimeloyl-ACP methyl ester carboxylesterase
MRMGIVLAVAGAALLLAAGGLFMLRPPTIAAEVLAARYGGPPSQFFKVAGGTIARYQDFAADEGQSGDALVLLHGGAMSLESWAPWIARLRGTRRIVAIDLPGHGLTGVTDENDYGVEAMAAFVKAVIDTLGLRGGLVVAGHSMGGHVAWRFALRIPRSFASWFSSHPADLPRLAARRRRRSSSHHCRRIVGAAHLWIRPASLSRAGSFKAVERHRVAGRTRVYLQQE